MGCLSVNCKSRVVTCTSDHDNARAPSVGRADTTTVVQTSIVSHSFFSSEVNTGMPQEQAIKSMDFCVVAML